MRSIGVRELRQQASRYLREVQRGESIEVTDHGRPIALLVPIPTSSTIDRLSAEGRLAPGQGDLLDLGPPLPPLRGVMSASQALAEDREHGR